jgi:hypothetical protein
MKRRNIQIRNLKIKMTKNWRKRKRNPNMKMRRIRFNSEKISKSTMQLCHINQRTLNLMKMGDLKASQICLP